ncbi:tripartite tricarboxylate transporter permease [Vibrio mangrovi]|uniref:Tripartite tricarboxylate transporter TctA family protein n=1 Tax=Vibrio mangrovi TaxID=474394 RepID=A0A1Y6IY55_9VIBR|nr:tripartite tricarboxylate transporter permease [Vibrio mangrovi]MDW6005233.1 tripartite tricarboxylate transporter permease [Vibrio mangrovi]SMS02556.1 Tripartite tricarboxylate transporter TctA family protein [Vibrio mangrovi]
MLDVIQNFAISWVSPQLLFLTALGTFLGVYIGAIPGLSVTMAVSILISFTFSWDINNALCLMVGVFMGGVYGGSRTAILLNIPGAPSAIATALDGYPMAQKGEAGRAIGLSTVMSVIGGFVGIIVLVVAAPVVSQFAIKFQPRDYLMLGMLGIMLISSLSQGSFAKGMFTGALGILVGTVGLDSLTAEERFTFGIVELWNGISPVAVMIGMFGVSEALNQLHHMDKASVKQKLTKIIPEWADVRRYLPLSLQSSLLGVTIGALPGTGGDIAALMAYDHAKRTTKNPEVPFGQGAREGLIAPEAANNAAVGGAYIPMLTLGIPGDAVTAVFIGALYIHGLNPGPLLLVENPTIFWFTVGNLVLANIFVLIFGLTGIRIFTKLVSCPKGILIPLIMILSIVGSYAITNSITDVWWALGFGIVGYFFKVYNYPVAPVILGVILSDLMDQNWRRALLSEDDNLYAVIASIFTSPISIVLFVSITLIYLSNTPFWPKIKSCVLRKSYA